MSKPTAHIHQVTPMHKLKSGGGSFFSGDPNDKALHEEHEDVRKMMQGITEERQEEDEEKMYAHELPPDPFMQKLTIEEGEEEEEEEEYDNDFMEESHASKGGASVSPKKQPKRMSSEVVSPIEVKQTTSKMIESMLDTSAKVVGSSVSSGGDNSNDSISHKAGGISPRVIATSPRGKQSSSSPCRDINHTRSPRSTSAVKRKKSASSLRQSPIRVNDSESSSGKHVHIEGDTSGQKGTTPRKGTPKKKPNVGFDEQSMQHDEKQQDEEEFDLEYDDFDFESDHSSMKRKENECTDVEKKKEEEDEMYESFDPLQDVNTEGEQSSNLIEGKLEGMTLDAYMLEYTKAKALDELGNDEDEDGSPPVVDPQGLEGISPGPGQRHINGTNSPFRIDAREFGLNMMNDVFDDDDVVQMPIGSPLKQNDEILAAILTQVQDVQNKLVDLSVSQNSSPVKKGQNSAKKGAADSGGRKIKANFQHSPIDYSNKGGALHIPDKVAVAASGAKGKQKHTKSSKENSANNSLNGADNNGHEDHNVPADVKVDVLKRQLKKKNDDIRRADDAARRMEKELSDMRQKWEEAESNLAAANKKASKATKAKTNALKKVAEMTQEMTQYESLIHAVENMRENEEKLLFKIHQLEEQNIEVSKALKSSMTRELEWRALYQKDHTNDHNNNNQHSHHKPSSGMNSHRSLPSPDRSHVRNRKAIFERNSITEGRQKKKSKQKDSIKKPKMLPMLISKQRGMK